MTTAAAMSAAYLKQLTAHGESITISDGISTTSAPGRLYYTRGDGVTDSVEQTECKAIVMASVAFPPERGFTVTAGGQSFVITHVDDMTRRVAGVTIAYDLTLAG